jgi:PAS domain S-box-containing protein
MTGSIPLRRSLLAAFDVARRHDILTAIICVLGAFLLRLLLAHGLGLNAPFVTFYPALAIASIVCGTRAGVIATILSALLTAYFWLEPVGALGIRSPADKLAMVIFLTSGALISAIGELLQRVTTKRQELRMRDEIASREALRSRVAGNQILRVIGEYSDNPIYVKDSGGRFLYVNPALIKLIGKSEADVLGRTNADFHGNADQAAAVMQNEQRIMQTGLSEVIEETFDAADGGTRTFRSSKSPYRAADGSVIGIVGISADITELRESERQLQELAADLEARVKAEVAAREAAQNRLSHAQRLEALGQLAGGIAHDFNNVLSAVQGGAKLIEDNAEDPERVRRFARIIGDASRRGISITRRLLSFARQADLLNQPIEAAGLLNCVREILAHTLGAGITVITDAPVGLPPLVADKGQLETVLINLATNARDAMQGTGTIRIEASLDVVSHEDRPEHPIKLKQGTYICLTVSDTGSGMTPEVLAHACEPFFSTKTDGQGTGLGLPMARGFADQCGGGLHIDTEVGRGTTVKLWFPMLSAAEIGAERPSQETRNSVPRKPAPGRLLVVDDDPLVLETMVLLMEAEGHAVVPAKNGAEAVARLHKGERVDLLVTDLSMPGMDGLELVQEVRRFQPGLRAIIVTGFATDALESALSGKLAAGVTLLRKPVASEVLAQHATVMLAGATNHMVDS